MTRRIVVLLALLGLMAGTTAAQDAKTVLQAASKAMGADNLKTIQITGTGTAGAWDRVTARTTTGRTSTFRSTPGPSTTPPSRQRRSSPAGKAPIHRAAAAERRFRESSSRC